MRTSTISDAWRLYWSGLRNRILMSPAMRRFALAFPPARPVARAQARALFDLAAGFVYSQVAAALVETGLLDALRRRPLALEEAADAAGLAPHAAATLLRAAAALDLAQEIGGAWTLGPRGAALAGSPGVAEMIAHHRLLYADLADSRAVLSGAGGGRLAALWRYDGGADPADVAAYSALMAASQPMVAEQALAAYRFARHRRMLDIGGGEGAFVAAVAAAAPGLALGLVDLPPVAARARARLPSAIEVHEGDAVAGPLPGGYDLMTLVRVLHDHDDGPATRLLANAAAALASGGRLLIVEPMADTPGARPMGHAYFGFYLAAMGSGRPRSFSEISGMARQAGFRRARRLATPLPLVASVILAER
jgi:demethylspheroidene O-methyltransferase